MNIEIKTLIYSMLNNLVVSLIKIISGLTFNLGSLLADGLHTFSDFITDIFSLIANKISKKKPTKEHPFGFGRVEYLTNLFIGIILLILGIFIFIEAITNKVVIPPFIVIYILIFTIILKLIAIIIMHKVGKKINSNILIVSVEESKSDIYSSLGVLLVAILLQFSNQLPILKYSDLICSLLICILVLKIALTIIIQNSLALLGEVEENGEIYEKLAEKLTFYKNIINYDIDLIKYGSYYKLQLALELDSSLTLKEVTKIVNNIKKSIKKYRSLKIKYITIYVSNELERKGL